MSDVSKATPKKSAAKAKKPKVEAAHPPVAVMVTAAVTNLKDRKGSSLAAIKKYIAANYKADAAKLAPFIRRYLRKAVTDGKLSQVKGTGAAGSFKLTKLEKVEKKKVKKPVAAKKVKKPKSPAKKAKATKSPAKKAKKAKTPTKAPAKKPAAAKKVAKPKKAVSPKKKATAGKKATKK